MDPERHPDDRLAPRDERPTQPDIARIAEPDAEVAVAYAAWRLDRSRDAR